MCIEWRTNKFHEVPDTRKAVMRREEKDSSPEAEDIISGSKEEKLHQVKTIALQGSLYESNSWFGRQNLGILRERGWVGAGKMQDWTAR